MEACRQSGIAPSRANPAFSALDDFRMLESSEKKTKSALRNLMPFVLEDYYPHLATDAYREAVDEAQRILEAP